LTTRPWESTNQHRFKASARGRPSATICPNTYRERETYNIYIYTYIYIYISATICPHTYYLILRALQLY